MGQGASEAAAELVDEVRAHQAAGPRARRKTELLLQPNDEVLLDMMGLVVAGAGADRWQPLLVQRARSVAQGQELIEVLEMAGVRAHRRGDRGRPGAAGKRRSPPASASPT